MTSTTPSSPWQTSTYPTYHRPTFARNIVSTSQPLAAQAGVRVLQKGGNAVDAALATAITLTIVEPISNGLGSDFFAILWDGKALHGLNASGRAPAAWTPEYFKGKIPMRGWNSVTVPGAVGAWATLSERFGALPFEELFESAIAYARDGFPVSEFVSRRWDLQVPELKSQPGFSAAFMPNGRAPRPGEGFRIPDAAKSLELIAATRGEAFYRGELAERMATHAKEYGGAMTVADLAAHTDEWVTPLSIDYRGYRLHEIPPNGQGIVALIALGILGNFDMAELAVDSADSVHLQIEAVKLGLADASRYVADSRAMDVAADRLLDPAYLKSMRRTSAMARRHAAEPSI
jgi:gamma-glutamyltranspeptidase/glutathione hydrolase